MHKYSKDFWKPRQRLSPVFDQEGKEVVSPLAVVEHKAAYWGSLWQASPLAPQMEDWWPELRRRAHLEERQDVDLEDLRRALRCFCGKVGQGG